MGGRGRIALMGAATLVALLVIAPAGASAATTVGQTASTAGDVSSPCAGPNTYITDEPTYVIPEAGVLTSWSVQGDNSDSGDPDELKLKVIERVGASTYRVVAEDPTTRTIALNTLNTFPVQIPVEQGQLLALYVGPEGTHPCAFFEGNAGTDGLEWGSDGTEPGIGDTFTVTGNNEFDRLNATASLETKKCKGQAPTIAGTPGKDTLLGTPGKDVIVGLNGKDKIKGLDGDDRLCGQGGKDKLKGGAGNDKLKGGKKADKLNGGGGQDKCAGGGGDDTAKKCEVEKSV